MASTLRTQWKRLLLRWYKIYTNEFLYLIISRWNCHVFWPGTWLRADGRAALATIMLQFWDRPWHISRHLWCCIFTVSEKRTVHLMCIVSLRCVIWDVLRYGWLAMAYVIKLIDHKFFSVTNFSVHSLCTGCCRRNHLIGVSFLWWNKAAFLGPCVERDSSLQIPIVFDLVAYLSSKWGSVGEAWVIGQRQLDVGWQWKTNGSLSHIQLCLASRYPWLIWLHGVEGQVCYCWWEVPGCFLWVLPKRSFPKPDQHRKDIIQQESLGTYML